MFETAVRRRLARADIVPDRGRAGDPDVTNARFYRRVALQGSLGLGESYIDRDWECTRLDVLVQKILQSGIATDGVLKSIVSSVRERLRRAAHPGGSLRLGVHHYDIGNDLYEAMLGPTMSYTCGWWPLAHTLDDAQTAKMEMVCKKLRLQPGMTLLDIGCGWGSLLAYASQNFGTTGVGVTVSEEQAKLARIRCKGLPIDIWLSDYRHIGGQFDRVVALGMFEHVERGFYRDFMRILHDRLKRKGLGLLHTIGKEHPTPPERWMRKYIFPLGDIPTRVRIARAAEGLLTERQFHRIGGQHYTDTLMAWHDNFNHSFERLRMRYDARFCRMWRFYLLACAGAFRAGEMQVWQFVYSRAEDKFWYTVPDF